MRGRHSAAILAMMGMTDTIAATIDDYVALAERLANDSAQRQALRARMQMAEHKVYRDRACITALEIFSSARRGQRRAQRRRCSERLGKIYRSRQEKPSVAAPSGPAYFFKLLKNLHNIFGMEIALVSSMDCVRGPFRASARTIVENKSWYFSVLSPRRCQGCGRSVALENISGNIANSQTRRQTH